MPNCCVVGCNNNLKNSTATLHNFPRKEKDPNRYKAWKNRINRANFVPNHNHVVCSEHFKEDFENRFMKTLLPNEKNVRKLKKTAIPSLLLSVKNASGSSKRCSTYIRKKLVSELASEHVEEQQCASEPDVSSHPMDTDVSYGNIEARMSEDIGVQCELGSEIYYKYSALYENDTDDESINSSELSLQTSDSENELVDIGTIKEDTTDDSESDGNIRDIDGDKRQVQTDFEFILVQTKTLLTLFKHCANCALPLVEIKQCIRGAVLRIESKCSEGHYNKWSSYDEPGKCTVHLSGALLLNGMNFLPFSNFARTLKLSFISNRTYYKAIRIHVSPVTNDFWLRHKNNIYEKAKCEEELWIAGDGQYDSPGFSAKYVTYTIMNVKTKHILNFVTLQRGMVEGDLEKAACEKALDEITTKLKVKLFLSDRHRGVGVLLRTKYPDIQHEFDVWHLSKSLLKKLGKLEKKSKLLSEWSRAITNHLWWSSETCEGNPQLLLEKFTSLLKHVCNIHEWTNEDGEEKTCEHRPLSDTEKQEIKWIRFGSTDYQALQTEIMNKTFLNDLKHTSHYCHTSSLESYHNVRLKYVPKRIHFSYNGMYIRSILAILDHNFNIDREVVGGDVQFSKASKRWHFKNKYEKKDYSWKSSLLHEIVNYDPKTDKLPEVCFEVPKNIYKTEKPTLNEAKHKHMSRFTKKN